MCQYVYTLRLEQNDHHSALVISICTFLNENLDSVIAILLKFVPEGPTENMSSLHYSDVIMSMMVCQITRVAIVYSIFCSGADQRKHWSSASLAFVRGIQWWPVNSLHKGPVMWKMFSFVDTFMNMGHAGCWPGNKPLAEPMMSIWFYTENTIFVFLFSKW